jgi:hypothetical protein
MGPFIPLLVLATVQQASDSALLDRSLSDLRTHPVEIVAKDTAPTVVRAHAFLDIDHDGHAEVFLAITPKYRQTATIVIYRALDSNRVARVYEGLAPGRLVPPSGRQVDTHTLGNGVDLSVEGGADSSVGRRVVGAARVQGMQIVRYPDFFHVDVRGPAAAFVDIASALHDLHAKTCESFEFSPVEAIATGHVGKDTVDHYLAVLTPAEVVFYRFRGVAPDGLLNKMSWSLPRPQGVVTLKTIDGVVVGIASDGRQADLELPR